MKKLREHAKVHNIYCSPYSVHMYVVAADHLSYKHVGQGVLLSNTKEMQAKVTRKLKRLKITII